MLQSSHNNGLETTMGRISVRLNASKKKAHILKTAIFNKGKSLLVFKMTPTVDAVGEGHILTVLRHFLTSK